MMVLLDALAEIGGDVRGVLQRSGLGLIEGAARDGRVMLIPRTAFAELAADCVLALHQESCRKNRLQPFPVRNHRLLLLAMLGCATLRDAIGVMTDFYAMLGERSARWTVTIKGNVVKFVLDRRTQEKSFAEFLISLFSLASYQRIFGWVIGEEIPLIDATLGYPDMLYESGLQSLFNIHPRFGEFQDSFSFAEHYMDWPIIRKSTEIDALFALFPFDLLPPEYGTKTFAEKLKAAMIGALSSGEAVPTTATLADMFGLTPATFRRRLAREGTSLVSVRLLCRRELAMTMLAGTNLTVREVASRLQYADVATFRRAFIGWTKITPSAWRAGQCQPAILPST